MQRLIFLLSYPLIYLIASIPFSALYPLSNFLSFILYYVIGYRKKIVRNNLKIAFPKKTQHEIKEIERKFFLHFTDVTLEAFKSLKMSKKEMIKRFTYKNIEVLKKFEKKKQSVIIIMGHYSSWEWMLSLGYFFEIKGYGIYTPIMNKFINELVKKIRKKHKSYLISRYSAMETMREKKKNGEIAMYGFASDQSPRPKSNSYWRSFLGVKVPVFVGAEIMSKELDLAIVYARVNRQKRGFYQAEFEILTEKANTTKEYEITDKFINLLEEDIKRDPSQYLWTHNRFKHSKLYNSD